MHTVLLLGLLAVAAFAFVIARTRWGLELRAVGGNVDAAISGYNAGLSSVRPGDGQRVGNTGTDADLNTPFINQGYVDAVKAAMAQFSTAQIATGGALVLLAIGAGVWWTMSHRKRGAT